MNKLEREMMTTMIITVYKIGKRNNYSNENSIKLAANTLEYRFGRYFPSRTTWLKGCENIIKVFLISDDK